MSTLVIGESLIDILHGANNDPTKHFPGGSPFNVAIGLAQLAHEVTLLTHIGTDSLGRLIEDRLREAGVHLASVSKTDSITSTAHVYVNEQGNPRYEFSLNDHFPTVDMGNTPDLDPERAQIKHLHFGSLAAHAAPGAEEMRKWLSQYHGNASISYDPNIRLTAMGSREKVAAEIESYIPSIDVFKASIEDLEPVYQDFDPKSFAHRLLDEGVQLVVITRGSLGLTMYTRHHTIEILAVRAHVVDTVGAGDSLMAALIDGLARLSVIGREEAPAIGELSPAMLTSLGSYAATAAALTVAHNGSYAPSRRDVSSRSEFYSSGERPIEILP